MNKQKCTWNVSDWAFLGRWKIGKCLLRDGLTQKASIYIYIYREPSLCDSHETRLVRREYIYVPLRVPLSGSLPYTIFSFLFGFDMLRGIGCGEWLSDLPAGWIFATLHNKLHLSGIRDRIVVARHEARRLPGPCRACRPRISTSALRTCVFLLRLLILSFLSCRDECLSPKQCHRFEAITAEFF